MTNCATYPVARRQIRAAAPARCGEPYAVPVQCCHVLGNGLIEQESSDGSPSPPPSPSPSPSPSLPWI